MNKKTIKYYWLIDGAIFAVVLFLIKTFISTPFIYKEPITAGVLMTNLISASVVGLVIGFAMKILRERKKDKEQ